MKKWKKPLVSAALSLFALGFSAPSLAEEGQVGSDDYIIQKGDSFWKIAQTHQINLQKLMEANPGVRADRLMPGTALHFPGNPQPSAQLASRSSAMHTIQTAAGQTLRYAGEITTAATAYTASPAENGKWGAVDYFGNPLQVGTIAVDPSVIPLGTTVYITGYSSPDLPSGGMLARAVDIGGAIKGKRIDIFVPSKNAEDFGIQQVKVYLIK